MCIFSYKINNRGVVTDKKGNIKAILGDNTPRQRRRYFFKEVKKQFKELAKAASSATGGNTGPTTKNF